MSVHTSADVQRAYVPSTSMRRRAARLLGETRARRLGTVKSSGEARAHNLLTRAGRTNVDNIERFRDRHAGETCVIIGNGPSLNDTELDLLRDVPTFGLNRLYLMYDKLGFTTTYHVVVNQYVVQQCVEELRAIPVPLFTLRRNRASLPAGPDVLHLNDLVGPRFSSDVAHGIWQGATVTYTTMQIAFHMGFTKAVLVGVDHNFVSKGTAHTLVESAGPDPNHFDPNYFGKGFRWQLPDLDTSEVAYRLADSAYRAAGRQIVDATVGGKLEVFPKTDLRDALR